jgi:fermentation-respiration switch protein FrsA (DUF1100 family)
MATEVNDLHVRVAAAKMPWPRRARRRAWRLTKSAVLVYVLVCVVIYALQTSLIFPGSFRQGSADVQIDVPRHAERLALTAGDADRTPLVAVFGKALLANDRPDPAADGRPTVLYFYGNGDAMSSALYQFDLFRHLGCNCIVIDYPGFGVSGGKPSEAGCYAAAEAAYRYVLSRPELDHTKLIPAGWSLGGAVAIDLAWRHREAGTIAGLMTFSTFTSMLDMAKHNYPMLPVGLLLKHHFASEEKVRDLRAPYFLGHGRADAGIPFGHSDRLAKAAGGPVTRFISDKADHNDFFDVAERELRPAMAEFLGRF